MKPKFPETNWNIEGPKAFEEKLKAIKHVEKLEDIIVEMRKCIGTLNSHTQKDENNIHRLEKQIEKLTAKNIFLSIENADLSEEIDYQNKDIDTLKSNIVQDIIDTFND